MAQDPVSTPRELRFRVNALDFAAQEWGRPGDLPVLALHGWLDNCASFFKLAPLLQNIHLVALDLAGHGQTAHRPGHIAYTPWDDIADIFAIADHLGWSEFVLLGHSRGAIIGTLAAGTFPERFLGLGLVEGVLPEAADPEQAPVQLASAISGLRTQLAKTPSIYTDLNVAIKARERGMFPLSREAATALTLRGIVEREGGYSWSSDPRLMAPSVIKLSREQLAAFVHRITAPVKLFLAHDGLPRIYPSYLQELGRFPQLDYQLLDGGHHLHMEQGAEQIAHQLNLFFASLSKS